MLNLRRGVPHDASGLSGLALRSKGHWGYDDAFLEACREELTLSPEEIENNIVFVCEADGTIAGFYAIFGAPPEGEVRCLFVDPPFIGRGYGKRLWDHMLDQARLAGFSSLLIDSDPNAEAFYAAGGALRIGESPSGSIPGRMLPLLRVSL